MRGPGKKLREPAPGKIRDAVTTPHASLQSPHTECARIVFFPVIVVAARPESHPPVLPIKKRFRTSRNDIRIAGLWSYRDFYDAGLDNVRKGAKLIKGIKHPDLNQGGILHV
jgi:hypothetical protein